MKHRKNIIGIIAAVMLLACLLTIPVMAQPPTPCAFSGEVTLDGDPCPGSIITVTLADGTAVATTPATVVVNTASEYGVVVPQDVGTGEPGQGDWLKFYVDGYWGDTATWTASGIETLDLDADTGEEPPGPTPPVEGTFASWLYETFVECLID